MIKPISNFNKATVIKIEGCDATLTIDFTDKRMANKILHLMKSYADIEKEMDDKIIELDSIEDKLEKIIAISDFEIGILERLRNDVNSVFNEDVVKKLYGDCLPDVTRYFGLFEALKPYIEESLAEQEEMVSKVAEKYGLARIS